MKFELTMNAENGVIKTNAKEMLEAIEPALKKYNYVVSQELYDNAKEDRASLNKLVKQISDERKRAEKALFGPWEQDKKAIMDIEKRIKAYADALGEGITQIDDEEKSRKEKDLKALWDTKCKRPYELVSKKEWLNKSWSMKKCSEDMDRLIEGIHMKEITVESFLPSDPVERQQVLSVFDATLDPILAKQEADKIVDAKKRVQTAYKAPEDLPRQNNEEAQTNIHPEQNEAPEVLYTAEFRCSGTKEQMNALAEYIFRSGIQCEVLRKWHS